MRSPAAVNLYQELSTWHREIGKPFRRFFSEATEETGRLLTSWAPAMEAFEKNGRFIVRADLPRITNELEISVLNDTLVVKGERKKSDEVRAALVFKPSKLC